MQRRAFTETEFAYWIQGAFEIGNYSNFDPAFIQRIHHRLNDVQNPGRLCLTVRMMLWHCAPEAAIPAISTLLNEIFIHDIDPTYEGDQEVLNLIHQGELNHA